jgi:hypothetical protein
MNQFNEYIQNYSEENIDFDYSYGDQYGKDSQADFISSRMDFNQYNDMVFGDQVNCFFTNQAKFEPEFELKNPQASVNDKVNFEFNWNSQIHFESFNEIANDKRCNSVDAKKPTEEVIEKNENKSNPSRACSDTNISVSLNHEDEHNDECDSLSNSEFVSDELSPEFEYECKHGDLNVYVEKLLSSNPAEYFKEQGIEVDEETMQKLSVNKRKRKTKAQKELLDAEYRKNQDWSKNFMQTLAKQLGMSPSSIYKWHWDQKNKDENETSTVSTKKVSAKGKKSQNKKSKNLE